MRWKTISVSWILVQINDISNKSPKSKKKSDRKQNIVNALVAAGKYIVEEILPPDLQRIFHPNHRSNTPLMLNFRGP